MKTKQDKSYEKSNHYMIVFYYRRAYTPTFRTKQEALNWIKAKGLTSKSLHYTELWKMHNETDGERELFMENSQIEMVDKQQLNDDGTKNASCYLLVNNSINTTITMAETPKVETPKVASRESLVAHLKKAEADTLLLVGTTLLNPYLYVKRNITPLREALDKAETITPELAAQIQAVKAAVLPK